MCQRFDVIFVFDGGSDLYGGVVSRVSASTIGYADKVRIQVGKCIQRIVDGLDGACLFGGKTSNEKTIFFCSNRVFSFIALVPFFLLHSLLHKFGVKNDLLHYSEKAGRCKVNQKEKSDGKPSDRVLVLMLFFGFSINKGS